MGELIRAYDWRSTSLGPPNTWPQGLKTAVRLLLSTQHPMFIWWGTELIQFYNDAYRRSIGPERHPSALGQRGAECWTEIWHIIGPQIEQVMTGRGATWRENELVPITRNGRREEVYWTYSYSPIDEPAAPSGVGGVLVVCTETTETVRSRGRKDFRVELGDAIRGLDDPTEIMAVAAERLGRHLDVDQANYYAIEGDECVVEREWRSAGSRGLLGRHRLADFGTVAAQLFRAGQMLRLDDTVSQDGSGGFQAAGMGAVISAPLHRAGRWMAGLHVHQTRPRSWTDAEVALVREVAERTWAEIERVRAAVSLKASEARFQAIVASIDQMIWSARADGWHDFYNQRWYDFTGVPEGSTDGEAWQGLFHPEDRERAWARWRRSLETGDRYESEHRLRHRSGQYRWVLVRAVPVRDGDASIVRWFGSCTDIEDIVQAREVLVRSHDELERQVAERTADRNRLWQLSTDLMLVTTYDGIMTAVNPAWTAVLGWSEQELVGRSRFDLIHPDDLDRSIGSAKALAAGVPQRRVDNRYRHKDGTYRWISWTAVPDQGLIHAVGRDFTADKENTEALELSEARMRSVFETSYQYQGLMTTDGILLDANPTSLAGIDARLEDVVGKPFWETPWFTSTPGMPEQVADAIPMVAAGNRFRQEIVVTMPTGRRAFDFSMRPVFSPAGDVIAIVPEAMELTERRAAEEQLRQSQKMEAIGQLTGGVAHDFNNLLTIIRSSADLLRRRDLPEDRRRRYVAAISDTADRAAKLTGQLLAFSRRQALRPRVFDLAERLQSITEMLAAVLGSRIALELEVAESPSLVEADVSQFETALVNLAANARDAMGGEGRLTIRLADADGSPSREPGAGGFLAVSVSDTGCGMPSEQLGQIFEPFFTTKGVGRGTGLGLSQVYGFARQSGGDVAVRSEVGHGATFTLTLPRAGKPLASPDQEGAGQPSLPRERGCVLVVEDNADVGEFSTRLLNDLGYHTMLAANAEEALKLLDENPSRFDLVFSDVVMPGMDGVALGQEVRRRLPQLPFVLASGYSHVLADEGTHGFELLHKPFSVESLSRVLGRAIRRC